MKKIIVLVLALMMLAFSACTQETEESVPTYNESGVSQSDIGDEEPPAAEPIFAETRQEAYYLAMSRFSTDCFFPDGSFAEGLEDDTFGKMEDNSFAVCDVDGDGNEELVIIFKTTCRALLSARVYDYNEETGELIEEWEACPSVKFYDNGYAVSNHPKNETHGTVWPYAVYCHMADTDKYEFVANVHSLCDDVESMPDCPWDYPYEVDVSGHGEVYYVDTTWGAYEEGRALDITEYEAWLDSKIGDAKEINVEYFPITQENVNNQLG
ncbi:MAG: hypothetical protein E7546_08175 [Ruminococcaceae bacterium]|nr:hypothetical protein [Oscillospiraceae bacterium]